MKTIPELLKAIDRIKGIQEASWNGSSYDIPWHKAIDQVVEHSVERQIVFSLIHNCWNDTESWLQQVEAEEKAENKLEKLHQTGRGKGTTNTMQGDLKHLNGVVFTISIEDSRYYRCKWPDGHEALLFIHEIELK